MSSLLRTSVPLPVPPPPAIPTILPSSLSASAVTSDTDRAWHEWRRERHERERRADEMLRIAEAALAVKTAQSASATRLRTSSAIPFPPISTSHSSSSSFHTLTITPSILHGVAFSLRCLHTIARHERTLDLLRARFHSLECPTQPQEWRDEWKRQEKERAWMTHQQTEKSYVPGVWIAASSVSNNSSATAATSSTSQTLPPHTTTTHYAFSSLPTTTTSSPPVFLPNTYLLWICFQFLDQDKKGFVGVEDYLRFFREGRERMEKRRSKSIGASPDFTATPSVAPSPASILSLFQKHDRSRHGRLSFSNFSSCLVPLSCPSDMDGTAAGGEEEYALAMAEATRMGLEEGWSTFDESTTLHIDDLSSSSPSNRLPYHLLYSLYHLLTTEMSFELEHANDAAQFTLLQRGGFLMKPMQNGDAEVAQPFTLLAAYTYLDVDSDGLLSRAELYTTFKNFHLPVTPSQLAYIMHRLDRDDNGEVNYLDWCGVWMEVEVESTMQGDGEKGNIRRIPSPPISLTPSALRPLDPHLLTTLLQQPSSLLLLSPQEQREFFLQRKHEWDEVQEQQERLERLEVRMRVEMERRERRRKGMTDNGGNMSASRPSSAQQRPASTLVALTSYPHRHVSFGGVIGPTAAAVEPPFVDPPMTLSPTASLASSAENVSSSVPITSHPPPNSNAVPLSPMPSPFLSSLPPTIFLRPPPSSFSLTTLPVTIEQVLRGTTSKNIAGQLSKEHPFMMGGRREDETKVELQKLLQQHQLRSPSPVTSSFRLSHLSSPPPPTIITMRSESPTIDARRRSNGELEVDVSYDHQRMQLQPRKEEEEKTNDTEPMRVRLNCFEESTSPSALDRLPIVQVARTNSAEPSTPVIPSSPRFSPPYPIRFPSPLDTSSTQPHQTLHFSIPAAVPSAMIPIDHTNANTTQFVADVNYAAFVASLASSQRREKEGNEQEAKKQMEEQKRRRYAQSLHSYVMTQATSSSNEATIPVRSNFPFRVTSSTLVPTPTSTTATSTDATSTAIAATTPASVASSSSTSPHRYSPLIRHLASHHALLRSQVNKRMDQHASQLEKLRQRAGKRGSSKKKKNIYQRNRSSAALLSTHVEEDSRTSPPSIPSPDALDMVMAASSLLAVQPSSDTPATTPIQIRAAESVLPSIATPQQTPVGTFTRLYLHELATPIPMKVDAQFV